jgi:thioredoxin-like negative regulator of GroEL
MIRTIQGAVMKKSVIVFFTAVGFLILGGGLILWSAHKNREARFEVTSTAGNVLYLDDANFEKYVVEPSKKVPILLDFYADHCLPCRLMDPDLRELAEMMKDRAVIAKIDTQSTLLGRRFGVTKLPTIIIVKDGEIKESFIGLKTKDFLIKVLRKYGA